MHAWSLSLRQLDDHIAFLRGELAFYREIRSTFATIEPEEVAAPKPSSLPLARRAPFKPPPRPEEDALGIGNGVDDEEDEEEDEEDFAAHNGDGKSHNLVTPSKLPKGTPAYEEETRARIALIVKGQGPSDIHKITAILNEARGTRMHKSSVERHLGHHWFEKRPGNLYALSREGVERLEEYREREDLMNG